MRFFEIFKRRFHLVTIFGIPVCADYRWVVVLALITVVTAGGLEAKIGRSGPESYLVAFVTTIVFFASVLVHELAHALIARIEGVKVLEIVLHPFGGLARLGHEPETPKAEFRIAAAGPAASFGLAILFAVFMTGANSIGAATFTYLFFLLAVFNFLIAVFNLFPGYPLDGGRLLRAYLWRSGRDINEATVLTGRCGQVIGGLMIAFGLWIALSRAVFFTGFWMILIGLFLYDTAAGIVKDIRRHANIAVMDVMMLPISLSPDQDLMNVVDHVLPAYRQSVFPVAKDKQLHGMLLLEDVKPIPREAWRKTLVGEVMRPVRPEQFVDIRTSVADARVLMRENGIGAVAVLGNDGTLVGFLGGGAPVRRASR
jgi:Zn-dependent protease